MEQTSMLVIAMAEQCKSLIMRAGERDSDLRAALGPHHLMWMCDRIRQHAEEWSPTKLHRWLGFVQCGMIANRIIDLDGAKAMFRKEKIAYGRQGDDVDLVDHLDYTSSFEMEIGGQG